jgi:hypothetical protein
MRWKRGRSEEMCNSTERKKRRKGVVRERKRNV